jgi:SAM-dependent methyltransferase
MKHNILLYLIFTSLSSSYFMAEASQAPMVNKDEATQRQSTARGLKVSDRPESLKNMISESFHVVSSNQKKWLYNGSKYYCFMGIDPLSLIQEKIKASPSQKDFYLLDIGAGQFDWGKTTAAEINAQKDLPNDIKVHIFSVTGEDYGPMQVQEEGRCKTYNIGSFKIEDLQKGFEEILPSLSLKGPLLFDLIVSAYTFMHVHDPVGLFVQSYDMLRPGDGTMLMHGFPVSFGAADYSQWNANMAYLLHYTKAPFLIGKSTEVREIAPFLLKRPDDKPLNLPFQYAGTLNVETANSYAKETAFINRIDTSDPFSRIVPIMRDNSVQGDKGLYDWVFERAENWQENETSWRPFITWNDLKK